MLTLYVLGDTCLLTSGCTIIINGSQGVKRHASIRHLSLRLLLLHAPHPAQYT